MQLAWLLLALFGTVAHSDICQQVETRFNDPEFMQSLGFPFGDDDDDTDDSTETSGNDTQLMEGVENAGRGCFIITQCAVGRKNATLYRKLTESSVKIRDIKAKKSELLFYAASSNATQLAKDNREECDVFEISAIRDRVIFRDNLVSADKPFHRDKLALFKASLRFHPDKEKKLADLQNGIFTPIWQSIKMYYATLRSEGIDLIPAYYENCFYVYNELHNADVRSELTRRRAAETRADFVANTTNLAKRKKVNLHDCANLLYWTPERSPYWLE